MEALTPPVLIPYERRREIPVAAFSYRSDDELVPRYKGQFGTSAFDRAAPTYGLVGTDFFADLGESLVNKTQIHPGDRVLDVGAGTGAVTLPASARSGADGSVIAIDTSGPMLHRLIDRPRTFACALVMIALMDAGHLGLHNECVDVALSGLVLSSLVAPEIAVAEMRRVLRSGGRLGMTVAPGWWWQEDTEWSWHADLVKELGVRVAHTPSSGKPFVQGLLAHAPWDQVHVAEERKVIRWESWTEFWTWCWSHGWRDVLEGLTAHQLARYQAEAKDVLGGRSPIEGQIVATLAIATKQ